jgi:hypothetical protein
MFKKKKRKNHIMTIIAMNGQSLNKIYYIFTICVASKQAITKEAEQT